MNRAALKGLLFRNRSLILWLVALALGTLAALYFAYKVDIFRPEGAVERVDTIEFDEVCLISAVVTLALLVLGGYQYRAQKREVTRRVAAERHARELAYQDGLTGLPNRRQFDEALRTAMLAVKSDSVRARPYFWAAFVLHGNPDITL